MQVYISGDVRTVGEQEPGLLLLENGSLICKSEYCTNESCDCTIVASGEHYCGDGDAALCRALIVA